jgi:hypothetical protein
MRRRSARASTSPRKWNSRRHIEASQRRRFALTRICGGARLLHVVDAARAVFAALNGDVHERGWLFGGLD